MHTCCQAKFTFLLLRSGSNFVQCFFRLLYWCIHVFFFKIFIFNCFFRLLKCFTDLEKFRSLRTIYLHVIVMEKANKSYLKSLRQKKLAPNWNLAIKMRKSLEVFRPLFFFNKYILNINGANAQIYSIVPCNGSKNYSVWSIYIQNIFLENKIRGETLPMIYASLWQDFNLGQAFFCRRLF